MTQRNLKLRRIRLSQKSSLKRFYHFNKSELFVLKLHANIARKYRKEMSFSCHLPCKTEICWNFIKLQFMVFPCIRKRAQFPEIKNFHMGQLLFQVKIIYIKNESSLRRLKVQ
jgi:hypothetical protein